MSASKPSYSPPPPDPALMSQVTRDRDSHPVPMDEWRINRLATFNSERARGIVHTEAWLDLMADEQESWDQQQTAEMLAKGGEEVSPGVWLVPGKRRFWRQRTADWLWRVK